MLHSGAINNRDHERGHGYDFFNALSQRSFTLLHLETQSSSANNGFGSFCLPMWEIHEKRIPPVTLNSGIWSTYFLSHNLHRLNTERMPCPHWFTLIMKMPPLIPSAPTSCSWDFSGLVETSSSQAVPLSRASRRGILWHFQARGEEKD